MNPPSDDAQLEALLRRPAVTELPDRGFSLRVLQALPPRRSAFARRRLIFCAAGVAASVALAIHAGAGWPEPRTVAADVETVATRISSLLADPSSTLALAAIAVAALLAWRSETTEA